MGDEAPRLFAAGGPDAVTIRDLAGAAGVSPALVVRHYQSKDELRDAADVHVARILGAVLAEIMPGPASAGPFGPVALPGLAEAVIRHLVLILRPAPPDVLGTAPLSAAGVRRWGTGMLSIYRDGWQLPPWSALNCSRALGQGGKQCPHPHHHPPLAPSRPGPPGCYGSGGSSARP
ncbi:MAG: helix-turn-helix domain-containing protein [Streptosporangiaceae bacterium]